VKVGSAAAPQCLHTTRHCLYYMLKVTSVEFALRSQHETFSGLGI